MDPKICYWCGEEADGGEEHVPPRAYFPKDQRQNLIVVPSCNLHNEGMADIDNCTRAMISLIASFYHDLGVATPPAAVALELSMKSLLWKEGKMAARLLSDLRGPLGRLDLRILNQGVEKIARGLYFHEFGEPCPYEKFVIACDSLLEDDGTYLKHPDAGAQLRKSFVRLQPEKRTVYPDVFMHQYLLAGNFRCLRMIFFGCVEFIALPELRLIDKLGLVPIADAWTPYLPSFIRDSAKFDA